MANDRHEDGAKKPPHSEDAGKQRDRQGGKEPKRDRRPTNDEIDEGLDETFPASDPIAPAIHQPDDATRSCFRKPSATGDDQWTT